jgi:hypothetical protein
MQRFNAMKLLIMSVLIFSTACNAAFNLNGLAKDETHATKIAKFKQENPHSLNIVMGFLKSFVFNMYDMNQVACARFPNMLIERGTGQEGPFVRLDTELTAELPQMLEGDKAPTAPNRLFQAIVEKGIQERNYVKLDECTRCAYFYQQSHAIGKFRCTTYVPKEVFEELGK